MIEQTTFEFMDEVKTTCEINYELRQQEHREYLKRANWEWKPGAVFSFNRIIAYMLNGESFYCYMERAVLKQEIESEKWIAEIQMGYGWWSDENGLPWSKDGTEVVVELFDINPRYWKKAFLTLEEWKKSETLSLKAMKTISKLLDKGKKQ